MMNRFLTTRSKQILNLFYPRLCAHCEQLLPQEKNTLCSDCFQQISFIDPLGRCRTCFAELGKGRCERCIHRSVIVQKQLAVCEEPLALQRRC